MSIKIASNTSAFKHCCPSAVIEAHCCGCTEAENPPLVSFFKYYIYVQHYFFSFYKACCSTHI